jgi:signal transduction histidine kinase
MDSRQQVIRPRPFVPVAAVAATGAAVTCALALVGSLRFAYVAPSLHVAIETAAALIALLATFLVYGRASRSRHVDDDLLLAAFALLALANLAFATIPAVSEAGNTRLATWASIAAHVASSILFALAALSPQRRTRLPAWSPLALAALLLLLDAGVMTLIESRLPVAVSSLSPAASSQPHLVGHPAVLAAQVTGGFLYALAAAGFTRSAHRRRDSFLSWIAVGMTLAALARANYALYPSLYSDWVYTGDVFRLAFYVTLLVAALHEITAYWGAVRTAAVLEERRRIARDLHDGLAQEVAYMRRACKLLLDPSARNGDVAERIAAAAERAVAESRQVIAMLASPAAEPLEAMLERVARDQAARLGVDVELDLAPGVSLDPARVEALVRITGEAVANAARHSRSRRVRIVLEVRGGRPFLQVIDRGIGFAAQRSTEPASGGFGLTSMRERAAAVGAELRIRTRPGSGTRVEVSF